VNEYRLCKRGQETVPSLMPSICCNTCMYMDSFNAECKKHKISVYGDFTCKDHTWVIDINAYKNNQSEVKG